MTAIRFKEKSTRNCIHAIVQGDIVQCEITGAVFPLVSVLNSSKFQVACEGCERFEHDDKEGK